MPPSKQERREALKDVYLQARDCPRCPQLAATRNTVVFGSGNADADLMFVGEAPGKNEDEQGLPFVGQAGKLLDRLLGEIGLTRGDVFIANVLKCRPPGNRDPHPEEIENCQDYLLRQVELIEPRVICTLGNFATKLLRADPTGITRLHGQRGGAGHRRARGAAVPDLPPGGGALHALQRRGAARPTSRASPSCSRWRRRRSRGARRSRRTCRSPRERVEFPSSSSVAVAVDDRQMGLF